MGPYLEHSSSEEILPVGVFFKKHSLPGRYLYYGVLLCFIILEHSSSGEIPSVGVFKNKTFPSWEIPPLWGLLSKQHEHSSIEEIPPVGVFFVCFCFVVYMFRTFLS